MHRVEHTEIRDIPDYTGIGVYALVGASGRVYIGSSVDVHQRIIQHCCNLRAGRASRKLQQAYDSGETFTAKVLHYLPDGITRGELRDIEWSELRKAGGIDNTYNNAGTTTYYPADVLYSPLLTLSLDVRTIDRWKAAASAKCFSLEQFVQDAVEAAIAVQPDWAP